MKATDKRPLGRTKLKVTVLGLGTATLGNLYAPVSDADAHDTVTTAFDAGVRFVDTAPFYGHGWSEHRVGEALRGYKRDDIVLSTKIGRLLKPKDPGKGIDGGVFAAVLPFDPVFDYSYDGVMRSVEDSLQRLGTHRIDVLLIHDVDRWTHGSQEAADRRMKEVLEGGYKAMVKLREGGAVGAIGAGLNEWDTCQKLAEASDLDCFLLAGPLHAARAGVAEDLPAALREARHRHLHGRALQHRHPRHRRGARRLLQLRARQAGHPGAGAQDRGRVPAPQGRARQRRAAVPPRPSRRLLRHPRREDGGRGQAQHRDHRGADPARFLGGAEAGKTHRRRGAGAGVIYAKMFHVKHRGADGWVSGAGENSRETSEARRDLGPQSFYA